MGLLYVTDGRAKNYKVPLTKQLLVQEGIVKAGDLLSDRLLVAKDLLAVKGLDAFCNYMIQEVQEVYQRQGVTINDKFGGYFASGAPEGGCDLFWGYPVDPRTVGEQECF